jgi:hypothetical protein
VLAGAPRAKTRLGEKKKKLFIQVKGVDRGGGNVGGGGATVPSTV